MRITKITRPRPFSFQPAPKAGLKFNIGDRRYTLAALRSGYQISTGGERLSITYRKGTAHAEISNQSARGTADCDFRQPTSKIEARAGGVTLKASGHPLDIINKLRSSGITAPIGVGLRILFHQKSLSPEFRERLLNAIRPLIPYEDYFPYFRATKGSRVIRKQITGIGVPTLGDYDPLSAWMCMVCILGAGPEDPLTTFPCIYCMICEAGSV